MSDLKISKVGQPVCHDLQSLQRAIDKKGLSFGLTVKSISDDMVLISDHEFGDYRVSVKAFAPSMPMPLHKRRRHVKKLESLKKQYVGQSIRGMTVKEIFYGPDRGYKNRSFYFEYTAECGHSGVGTYAQLSRHRKTLKCQSCNQIVHAERTKVDGKLKKRSSTYLVWSRIKDKLPNEYKDYEYFRQHLGEKPYRRADVEIVEGRPVWVSLALLEDEETNLIATAIRQAFRHSAIYKHCLENAKIETESGTRYRCEKCGELFRLKDIQVDHIDPIKPLDGRPLRKDELIDRIWTEDIQVLDRKCHSKKSAAENRARKLAKAK